MTFYNSILLIAGVAILTTTSKVCAEPVAHSLVPANYSLISKNRVGRTELEYEYTFVTLNNSDTDLSSVVATVTSSSVRAVMVDGVAEIGNIFAHGSKGAVDTIKVRVDRRDRFSPYDVLQVSYDNGTVQGIDTNDNGVRDDLDVVFDEEYGTDSTQRAYIGEYARALTLQATGSFTANESKNVVNLSRLAARCLKNIDGYSDEMELVLFYDIFDNDQRLTAYEQFRENVGVMLFDGISDEESEEFCAGLS